MNISMSKRKIFALIAVVITLITVTASMMIYPSADALSNYTNQAFTNEWLLSCFGGLFPQIVFSVVKSLNTTSVYDYYFVCINQQEQDKGLLYVVEDDCYSTNITSKPMHYTWRWYHMDVTDAGIYKPVQTKCAIAIYGLNVTNQISDLIYDGISYGGTYTYKYDLNATGILIPYCVGNVSYIYDGSKETALQTISAMSSCLTKEGCYSLAEINYLVTHKENVSDQVLGYDWYCPADIDSLINGKTSHETAILGQYHWYSKSEWDMVGDKMASYIEQLTDEQLKALDAYQRGLADGRSDVSSIGDGITSLGTNIGTAIQTVLKDISLGGITLGDLLLFLVFGVIILVIIIVVIRLVKG